MRHFHNLAASGRTSRYTLALFILTVSFVFLPQALLQAQCTDLTVSCFVVGPTTADIGPPGGLIFRDQSAFVSVPYLEEGHPAIAGYVPPTSLARHRDVGTVFGAAWPQPDPTYVFVSAYMKRGTGFGPLGPGGIYRIAVAGTPPANVTQWATVPSAGSDPHNFGDYLSTDYDNAVTDAHAGKSSLGDIETNLAGTLLYVVNLQDKHLYSMPTTGTPPVTVSDLGLITSPTGCTAGDFRPFGLGVNPETDVLYVGAVCSNESGTSTDGLRGYILEYSGGLFTKVFDFDLNYTMRSGENWVAWSGSTEFLDLQPLLSDVGFLGDDLILGLRERKPDYSYTPSSSLAAHGDVLRACWNGTGWDLENNRVCGGVTGVGGPYGPGGGSFFYDRDGSSAATQNANMGSVAVADDIDNTLDRVVGTFNDPYNFVSGGFNYMNPTNGAQMGRYEVFQGSPNGNGGINPVYGKTNGLGDLEVGCALPVGLEVEWGQLEISLNSEGVLLQWTTLRETNNVGFAIEHAMGTRGFEEIGFVAGNGTTNEVQSYTYAVSRETLGYDMVPGLHQFRLRQIDFDGNFSYSPVAETTVVPKIFYLGEVYPNPFNPQAILPLVAPSRQQVQVALYDVTGRHVRDLFAGQVEAGQVQQVHIDGSRLVSGMYMVRVIGENFVGTRTVSVLK